MEDIKYPLTPIQLGMLFNSIRSPNSGVEIEQVIMSLNETISIKEFKAAWLQLINNHDVLRTRFEWEAIEQPLQIVSNEVDIPFEMHDWQHLQPEHIDKNLQEFLKEDRLNDIVLSCAPLLRLNLFAKKHGEMICLWTFHHAILDGRSFSPLINELFAIYESLINNQEAAIKKPVPFRHFAHWIGRYQHETSDAYWRKLLHGVTAPTPLTNILGPDNKDHAAGVLSEELFLPAALTDELKRLAKKIDVTLNTLVQAAWAILLHRYSGEADIVFGNTRACRHASVAGSEEIIGVLINTVPVRLKVALDNMLVPWLQGLRQQHLSVREFEHSSLVRIQRCCQLPSQTPLFESLVVFEGQTLNEELRSKKGNWSNREFRYIGQTGFPLALICYSGAELLLRIEYTAQRFSTYAIKSIMLQLQTICSGMVENVDRTIGEIPYIEKTQRQQLLERYHQNDNPLAVQPCIHKRFEQQVEKCPDAIALTFNDQTLTYQMLNQSSNRLASELIKKGLNAGSLVGLSVERSFYSIIGILGILKAGGAYLPLDPSYPEERLAFILEDSQSTFLVTQESLADKMPDHQAEVISIDSAEFITAETNASSFINPSVEVSSDDIAYVIYTSGSTGKPKGVLIPHKNVVRLFSATEHWFNFNEEDVWSLFHSYAFDFSVWEIWGALFYGGRLVIIPYMTSRSPDLFYETLIRENVTVLNQTPSAFRQLIQSDISSNYSNKLALRYVIFGGEALDLSRLKPWFEAHEDNKPQLVNMYGITETTVHVTYRAITKEDVDKRLGSVIGQPIPDLQLYVLDERLNPVPVGMRGNLFVAGAGLAKGYLNRAELSKQRFISHPFKTGARLYDTGDVVRFLPNEDIEYLGRSDQQVKIRGFRIELGEIEAVLNRYVAVNNCVVTALNQNGKDARLVAYWVAEAQNDATASELREHLKSALPDYMVPAVLIKIDSIPLTENGKLDFRHLPAPQDQINLDNNFVAAGSSLEREIASIWKDVLGLSKIGIHDNFFELGGDSFLVIELVGKISRATGNSIPVHQLFEFPTISSLASFLSPEVASASAMDVVLNRAEKRKAALAQRKKQNNRNR
ncbi:MAG: amino acid adenylation domain-containing protein [Gammaproteobacteria bacterium]|nr:amino acid adenylation domain-containing protein [Gammaproteobacteria bacterium]